MVGQTVGKYRVVSRLGRGGMGTVYKAVDETLDREVAIKCLNPDLNDPEVLKRFRAEAVTLARLNHPNIATLFELTEHDGQQLMVMEFVRGETFDKLSLSGGPMPILRASQLCGQVFDALAHAHRAGIVHRDLKPANLMLTESGAVKVMDFGLARMAGTEHLTNDGYMVGTPAYMSPEQVLGWEIDGRADLYSMGVVLFRLLTGQLPFKAESGIAMAQKQINDPPTPVRQLRTELSWEVEEVLKRSLAKPPGDRYQTADDFKAALSAVVLAPSASLADSAPTISLTRTDSSHVERTLPPTATPVMTARPLPLPKTAPMPALAATAPMPAILTPASSSAVAGPSTAGPPAPARRFPVAAAVIIGAVLLAGVPAILIWRARAVEPAAAGAPAAAVSAPVTAPVTAPPAAAPTAGAPAAAEPPPVPPPVAAPATAAAAPATGPDPAAKRAARTPPPVKEVAPAAPAPAPEPTPPAPTETAPTAARSLPVVTFGKLKLLTFEEEGKTRDRDASLRLGPDGLEVFEGKKAVQSTSYQEIVGVFHSHSREPRWATPDGTAVPVVKTSGGKFSLFRGVPDWITVRTRNVFIPLRVDDDDLARLITELETRTGTKVVRTR